MAHRQNQHRFLNANDKVCVIHSQQLLRHLYVCDSVVLPACAVLGLKLCDCLRSGSCSRLWRLLQQSQDWWHALHLQQRSSVPQPDSTPCSSTTISNNTALGPQLSSTDASSSSRCNPQPSADSSRQQGCNSGEQGPSWRHAYLAGALNLAWRDCLMIKTRTLLYRQGQAAYIMQRVCASLCCALGWAQGV